MRRLLPLLAVGLLATGCALRSGSASDTESIGATVLPASPPARSGGASASDPDWADQVPPRFERGTVLLGVSSPHDPDRPIDRRITDLERAVLSGPFGAVRLYHRWDEPFPTPAEEFLRNPLRRTTPVLSISSQRVDGSWIDWDDIANASPGSRLGRQIARWAADIAAWDGPRLMVTFDHEPDFYRNGGDGEPEDYIAAYRRVADEIRAAGADVDLAWISVAFFFRPGGGTSGPDFFPGTDHVDVLGVDGFNWWNCRNDNGSWRQFEAIFDDFRRWASDEHPDLPVIVAEVGTVEDSNDPTRKAEWLRRAADSMADWPQLQTVVFWDNIHEDDPDCDFRLASSPSSARAFAAVSSRALFAPG